MKLLGHDYEVQPALETPDGTKRPDYVLYRSAAAVAANKNRSLNEELLRGSAFAVGDAKYWERPLDVSLKGKGNPFTNKNPSFQISFYMQHAGAQWGMLTNGRLWRLYHKDTAHKLDRFYEVDLHELATGGDVGRFLYFYAFFHRSAFEEHPLSGRDDTPRKRRLRPERRRFPEEPGLRSVAAPGAGVPGSPRDLFLSERLRVVANRAQLAANVVVLLA